MRILVLPLLIFFAVMPVSGRQLTEITDSSLITDANALINEYHITYEVKSPKDIRKTIVYKATILNQNGKGYGRINTITDSRSKLTAFNGLVKNENGIITDKIKMSDLHKSPSYPDYVFASDSWGFYYYPAIDDYPYTVEYEEVISYSGLMAFESWLPIDEVGLSCDTASYTIIYPSDYKIRYQAFNIENEPVIKEIDKDRNLISWSISKFGAIELNGFIPPVETFLPYIMIMPVKFNYNGYDGTITDYTTYGMWVLELLKGRDELKPETGQQMAELTAGATGTREKVSIVYKYLQQNTRYVAIAYGIGGLQPAPAMEVAQYGYGDCKGLSNYMKALLASLGIKSFYTEIGNGNKRIIYDDFAYLQTNHAILCVPDGNDTIWLECTNPYYNAGYIGYSNSNRKALLVTGDGGKIVNTPIADSSNNYRRTRYDLKISSNGSSTYKTISERTGRYYEKWLYVKNAAGKDAIKYFYNDMPFKNHTINSFTITTDTSRLASLTTVVEGTFSKYATTAGKRLIVPMVPWKMFSSVPKFKPERKAPVYIANHTACSDTIYIQIPDGYKIPAVEENTGFSNEIGSYRQSASVSDNMLQIIRTVQIPAGIYPAELKDKVTEFYKKSHDIEKKSVICELIQ